MRKWLIHMKSHVAGLTLLILHVSYDWPHDCSNRGVEEITRLLATNHFSSREGQGSYIAANQAILSEYAKEKS